MMTELVLDPETRGSLRAHPSQEGGDEIAGHRVSGHAAA
jgi:hypothetical protein